MTSIRIIICLVCILAISFILHGCTKPQTIGLDMKSGQFIDQQKQSNIEVKLKKDQFIQVKDVKWITKTGGLPLLNKRFKVLVPQRNAQTIEKIINLVNSTTNRRKSTKEEEESLLYGRPRAIEIRLIDGRTVNLWPSMNIVKRETSSGTEYTGSRYNDRFILNIQKDGGQQFFTDFSQDVTRYILAGSDADIPLETISTDEFSKTTAFVLKNTTLYDKPNGKESSLMDGPPPRGKELPDKADANQQVLIEERNNGWVRGQFAGGLTGWIPEKYIEFVGPDFY